MNPGTFLNFLRETHRDCCLTDNCADYGCRVKLDGIDPDSLAIIHGERHRDAHGDPTTKIADRIIFADWSNHVVVGLELKGGNSIRLGDAIEQIQMAMRAAELLLDGQPVDDWHPVLIYSGRWTPREERYLQRNRVMFLTEEKTVARRPNESELDSILDSLATEQ